MEPSRCITVKPKPPPVTFQWKYHSKEVLHKVYTCKQFARLSKTTYHKYKMRINLLFYLDMQSLDIFLKENFAFCNSSTSLYGLYTWDSFLLNLCKYIFQKDALMFLCWEFIYLQKRLNKKFEMPTSYFKMKGLNFLSII